MGNMHSQERELVDLVDLVVRRETGGLVRGLRICNGTGGIIVQGATDSYYNKQLVTRAALSAIGTTKLLNEIVVSACPENAAC